MTKARGIRRRIFLGGAIGAGAGLLGFPPVVSRQALGSAARPAPSDLIAGARLRVAPRGPDVMEGRRAHGDARVVAVSHAKAWVRD